MDELRTLAVMIALILQCCTIKYDSQGVTPLPKQNALPSLHPNTNRARFYRAKAKGSNDYVLNYKCNQIPLIILVHNLMRDAPMQVFFSKYLIYRVRNWLRFQQ